MLYGNKSIALLGYIALEDKHPTFCNYILHWLSNWFLYFYVISENRKNS